MQGSEGFQDGLEQLVFVAYRAEPAVVGQGDEFSGADRGSQGGGCGAAGDACEPSQSRHVAVGVGQVIQDSSSPGGFVPGDELGQGPDEFGDLVVFSDEI